MMSSMCFCCLGHDSRLVLHYSAASFDAPVHWTFGVINGTYFLTLMAMSFPSFQKLHQALPSAQNKSPPQDVDGYFIAGVHHPEGCSPAKWLQEPMHWKPPGREPFTVVAPHLQLRLPLFQHCPHQYPSKRRVQLPINLPSIWTCGYPELRSTRPYVIVAGTCRWHV
jgi:hypothetical protein